MKKVYLIHGWEGSYTQGHGWFDDLRKKLPEKGYELDGFDMPNTDAPVIEEWVGFMKEKIKDLDDDTYLISHSIGAQAILRYLETLPEGKKIKGCVFVAGWFNLKGLEEEPESIEIVEPWIKTPIDFEKVKSHCDNFLVILSDNDPWVPIESKELFEKKLGAKVIILQNKEHFNEVSEIPEILEFIK